MAVRSTEVLTLPRALAAVRSRVVLLYLAALVPALLVAAYQPVWSRVDEPQHADVLSQYAHGVVPVEGVTVLQPEIVAVDEATGVYRWYPAGYGPVPGEDDPQAFVPPPASASVQAQRAWTAHHLWGFSYEAMQPPLYYMLALPDWVLGDRFGGTLGAIYAARLFSALIAACLAPLAYLLALTIRPGAERMALIAGGLAALLPGYVLNATQVTNDGLAAVLGAGLTLVAVKGARDGWTRPLAVTCGVLLGAAAMTKLTAIGLVPLVAAAFLWPAAQPLLSRVAHGAIAAVLAAVVVAPWLLFNLHTYGQPVPSAATRDLLGAAFAPPSGKRYLLLSARNALGEFIAGEPYGVMPLTRQLHWLEGAFAVLAAIGLWIGRRRLRLEYLLAFGAGADLLWVLVTPYLSGVGGVMPGRYLYPAAAAVLVLIAAGVDALPSLIARAAGVAGTAAMLLVVVLLLNAEAASAVAVHRTVLPPPDVGVTVHAQGDASGLGVVADRIWVADGGHTIWVHVTVTDTTDHAVDYSPMAVAWTTDGVRLADDYHDSTPFPERLQPGETASGWLRFPRAATGPVPQLMLRYSPVTSDGYTTVDTLTFVVAP